MFARITTFYTADPSSYSDLELRRLLLASNQEVLRQMDGLKNIYIFKSVDRQSGKALVITLWESEEAMHRSEEAVRTLRKETAGALAANIVAGELYEVWEILEQERRERERVEQELRVARTIQQASLPKEVPNLEGWQIYPLYRPAREVGGDFYDFFELDDGRLGIVVGDATGHGVPAALVMASARSMLRAVAQASDSPGDALRRVNDPLATDIPPNMFVTCFYAICSSPASMPSSTPKTVASPTPTRDTTCLTCTAMERSRS